jgi:hypothetical protein
MLRLTDFSTRAVCEFCLVAIAGVAAMTPARAANFAPITGSLSIRAGGLAPKMTPAAIGSVSLFDNDFPVAAASASLTATLHGGSQFDFSADASSLTNSATPVNPPNATAMLSFEQSFTTTAPQWLQLTSKGLNGGDPNVAAFVTLGLTGHAPFYVIGDTADQNVVRNALFPAGTYSLFGTINTSAPVSPAHAGALSGFVLIASLADFNGNQTVDGADLSTWKTGFGSKTGTFASGNLDGDGDTDGTDFLLWQRQLGAHALAAAATSAVPEPASITLGLVVACGLALRRKNH